jgi:ADP-ribosylglycohydrolase
MLQAAVAETKEGAVVEAIRRGAAGKAPSDFMTHQGWVLLALQSAFYQLMTAGSAEEGIISTVACGGDTDTNAAIAGALLGAAHGRDSIPSRWIFPIMGCRSPRPPVYWPDDSLDLAEALLHKQ